jgi:type II secretory pathway pseudopilin PulG
MKINRKQGMILIQVVMFAAIAAMVLSAIVTWAGAGIKNARYATAREQAFYIAEAGIEYYRWHLAHAQADFKDGTTTPGPYVHPYYNSDGDQIGAYSLAIVAPPAGSTLVTITSTGSVTSNAAISRVVEAKLAIPSLAKYAFVANTDMRFGEGTEMFGELQSNGGIRFDGIAHNLVSSALANYNDPDHSGGNDYGVHTHVSPADPLPPTAVPNRPDVFEAGRRFPVPAVDFNGFTTNKLLEGILHHQQHLVISLFLKQMTQWMCTR